MHRHDPELRAAQPGSTGTATSGTCLCVAPATGVLAEVGPVDRVRDIGLAATEDHVQGPEAWRGLDLLGFTLMDVRMLTATKSASLTRAG